jgi:hypothetical protein
MDDLFYIIFEGEQLNDLWFTTTQFLKYYSKSKKIKFSGNKFLNSRSI